MNEIKITKTNAVCTIENVGVVTMPADTGRETKKIYVANEAGNKANLALCMALNRIRQTESYKEIFNKDGENITPTFGDYAEKIVNMSKGGASNYATIGDVFGAFIENDKYKYKYGHYCIMLKLRKLLDDNGNPLTGNDIVSMLEEHGASAEMSTRALDTLVKSLLCDDTDDTGDTDDTDDTDDGNGDIISITTAFDVVRAYAEKSGKWETAQGKILELEKLLEV